MPRVSVILPVYNGATTIRKTIVSALQQTFSDFELIVIDDGSHDSTLSVLDEFRDRRLIVRAYSNAGPATSRNRGLNFANGEMVAFLDADDVWSADKLESQLAALDEHPEAALAYVWTDYIDGADRLIHRGQHPCNSGWVLDSLLLSNFLETCSNPMVRRDAITECGGFDESLIAGEDWDMWLRLAMRYPFAVVKRPLVLYRVHPGSTSSSDVLRLEHCCLEVIERAFRRANAPQNLKRQSIANLYLYLTARALTPPLSRESGRLALRFLRSAVRLQPSLLVRSTLPTTIAVAKIGAALMLPSGVQRVLVDVARSLRSRTG
jgi:glycosyltransferase involved in cell wall biosynthesis